MLEHKDLITAFWLSKEQKHARCPEEKKNSDKKVVNQVKVSLDDIISATTLNIEKNHVKIKDKSGEEYSKRISLRRITEIDKRFIFLNKDTVVNTLYVDTRFKWEYLWIKEDKFRVSRSYKEEVEKYFSSVVE